MKQIYEDLSDDTDFDIIDLDDVPDRDTVKRHKKKSQRAGRSLGSWLPTSRPRIPPSPLPGAPSATPPGWCWPKAVPPIRSC